jgi:hypothetical protein
LEREALDLIDDDPVSPRRVAVPPVASLVDVHGDGLA